MKRLKKVVLPLSLVGMLALCSTSVFAEGLDISKYGKGSEIIDGRTRDGITSGSMDGGYWIRGKRGTKLISEYKHYKTKGRASVTNGIGDYNDGGWKEADTFSKASVEWTSKGINRAYYDNKQ